MTALRRASVVMLSFALGAASLASACGGSTSESSPLVVGSSTAGASCETLARSASTDVQSALSEHAACTVDADCIVIEFATQCFDSCTRAVASSGKTDVQSAKDRANAGPCKQFVADGCKLIIPPCAPPSPPHCATGRCE